MTKVQKEGVLITTVSVVALLILALLTSWTGGFSEADFYFEGLATSCTPIHMPPTPLSPGYTICEHGTEYIHGFSIKFRTILIFFIPIIFYGILRAFGIVNRLFQFEEKLFKFIDE